MTAPGSRRLPPFPSGWYAVAFSDELRPGHVRTITFMGADVVITRGESGDVRAFDAYCPHMGGHLGGIRRTHHGCIQCPFHGFRFDESGRCRSTPYDGRVPNLSLGTMQVDEVNGAVLLWHGPGQPEWRVQPDARSSSGPSVWCRRIRSHPQETTENSVDVGHFVAVHRFSTPSVVSPLTTNGPRLRTAYEVGVPSPQRVNIRVRYDIDVQGLGYSQVEVTVLPFDIQLRYLVLATPVDAERIDLRLAAWAPMREGATRIPRSTLAHVVQRAGMAGLVWAVRKDIAIWERKAYLDRPRVTPGDGPIARYRIWCQQFYENEVVSA